MNTFQLGRLHNSDANNPRSQQLPDNPLVGADGAKVEFALRCDQNHGPADDDKHRDVLCLARHRPGVDLAAEGLLAPGIAKARVAADLDAVLRCGQYQFWVSSAGPTDRRSTRDNQSRNIHLAWWRSLGSRGRVCNAGTMNWPAWRVVRSPSPCSTACNHRIVSLTSLPRRT